MKLLEILIYFLHFLQILEQADIFHLFPETSTSLFTHRKAHLSERFILLISLNNLNSKLLLLACFLCHYIMGIRSASYLQCFTGFIVALNTIFGRSNLIFKIGDQTFFEAAWD